MNITQTFRHRKVLTLFNQHAVVVRQSGKYLHLCSMWQNRVYPQGYLRKGGWSRHKTEFQKLWLKIAVGRALRVTFGDGCTSHSSCTKCRCTPSVGPTTELRYSVGPGGVAWESAHGNLLGGFIPAVCAAITSPRAVYGANTHPGDPCSHVLHKDFQLFKRQPRSRNPGASICPPRTCTAEEDVILTLDLRPVCQPVKNWL